MVCSKKEEAELFVKRAFFVTPPKCSEIFNVNLYAFTGGAGETMI